MIGVRKTGQVERFMFYSVTHRRNYGCFVLEHSGVWKIAALNACGNAGRIELMINAAEKMNLSVRNAFKRMSKKLNLSTQSKFVSYPALTNGASGSVAGEHLLY